MLTGLPSYLAYGQQCLVPPMLAQPYVPSDVTVAPTAPPSSVGLSSTSVAPVPSSNVVVPTSVATIGADTRSTVPVVDTKVVPNYLLNHVIPVSAIVSWQRLRSAQQNTLVVHSHVTD